MKQTVFLALQADYHSITMGIGHNQTLIAQTSINKLHACQQFMPALLQLMHEHATNFSDLSFIAVNRGPAPFTTLRIVITTANALNFAHNIPLVGVDALEVFAKVYQAVPRTVVLLNAFSHDIYYAYYHNDTLHTGCQKYQTFFDTISLLWPTESISFVGNGATLYHDALQTHFNQQAHFITPACDYTSLESIAHAAYIQWEATHTGADTLLPLYLKIQTYIPST